MVKVHVQFADADESQVVAYFAGPQDQDDFPHQGVIEVTDARWRAFYEAAVPDGVHGVSSLPFPTGS